MNRKNAFTLIELLVVISIIAVLMSIMMPALAKVREQGKRTLCLSNLRQVALGALTYEADNGRLPAHVWELSENAFGASMAIPTQVTMGLTNPNYDVRPLYASYVSVNYFKCPLVPQWKRDISDIDNTYNIYTDYFISGGYWANLPVGKQWINLTGSNYVKGNKYTKSSVDWSYHGQKFNVLYGDQLMRYLLPSPRQFRTNHIGKNKGFSVFNLEAPNNDRWVSAFYYGNYSDEDTAASYLKNIVTNYTFADGSGRGVKGDDACLVEMPHRRDNNYTIYLPSK